MATNQAQRRRTRVQEAISGSSPRTPVLFAASSSGSVLLLVEERDASYAAGSPTLAPSAGLAEEAFHLERLLPTQHVMDAPAELRGQDREALARTVLRLKPPGHLLSLFAVADEERGAFGEGPLQVGVADLPYARSCRPR